jgi:hypothetical protein
VHVNWEKLNGKNRMTTDQDLGDKITPFGRLFRVQPRSLAPLLVRNLPLGLRSYISQPRPSRGQRSLFCTLLSLSCQTSSPPRLTRAPLRPSALSQRMSSERQTQVIQVSFCTSSTEIEVFITFRSPLGAPMGMAPVTHVLFTRSAYRHCTRALRFIGLFGQIFQR